MNLACQKCLGNLPKVLGIGVTPPPFGKNSQKIPFFLNESPPYCRRRNFKSGDHVDYYDEKVGNCISMFLWALLLSGEGGRVRRWRRECNSNSTPCIKHNTSASSCSVTNLISRFCVMIADLFVWSVIQYLVRSPLFACATVFIVKHLPEQFIIRAGLIKCVQVTVSIFKFNQQH